MNWLKKNLSLVIGGAAAVGLLGFAIFFLLTGKQAADDVTAQLNEQTDALKKLVARDPHPNQENIEAARREQKKLAEFLQESRKFFVPVASFTNIDSAVFKDLLQTSISDLEHGAMDGFVRQTVSVQDRQLFENGPSPSGREQLGQVATHFVPSGVSRWQRLERVGRRQETALRTAILAALGRGYAR